MAMFLGLDDLGWASYGQLPKQIWFGLIQWDSLGLTGPNDFARASWWWPATTPAVPGTPRQGSLASELSLAAWEGKLGLPVESGPGFASIFRTP